MAHKLLDWIAARLGTIGQTERRVMWSEMRPMTPAEKQAFDRAFLAMDKAFSEMDAVFRGDRR